MSKIVLFLKYTRLFKKDFRWNDFDYSKLKRFIFEYYYVYPNMSARPSNLKKLVDKFCDKQYRHANKDEVWLIFYRRHHNINFKAKDEIH